MKSAFIPFLTLLTLAGCAPTGLPAPQKEFAFVSGPWAALPKSCQVHGLTADFTLATDGHVEKGNLYIYLTFKAEQAAPPSIAITGVPLPLAPEGKSPIYSFKMPFNPTIAARLNEPSTYFTIRYYNTGTTNAFESALPTPGFINALNLLDSNCP
jgi:hypothetical protein